MYFNRQVKLTVGQTKIIDLDIAFEINKSLKPEPNTARISIFNLNPENRAYLAEQEHVPVELEAGYAHNLALIFRGDLIFCRDEAIGPDIKTTLISGDGSAVIKNCYCNQNFAAGTAVCDIAIALTKYLNIPTSDAAAQIKKLVTGSTPKSTCLEGQALGLLEKLLAGQKLETSIQDGALQVLPKGQALQHEAIVLNADTGLLQGPVHPEAKQINIKTLLLPTLYPGRLVSVDNNLYRIETMRLEGDSFGGVWCAEIGASNQS